MREFLAIELGLRFSQVGDQVLIELQPRTASASQEVQDLQAGGLAGPDKKARAGLKILELPPQGATGLLNRFSVSAMFCTRA
jgi:hypothetical protein